MSTLRSLSPGSEARKIPAAILADYRLAHRWQVEPTHEGCVVVVSNNRALWESKATRREALWDAFRLTDGTALAGRCEWRPTDKKWPGEPIELSGEYRLVWRPSPRLTAAPARESFDTSSSLSPTASASTIR